MHHVKVYSPTEFGVPSSKFPCTGGPHVKKTFPPLARAACTAQKRQPQKHTRWGCIRVTCKFEIGDVSRLTYMARTDFCNPLRGSTCHVQFASRTLEKCKSSRPPGGSIHPANLVRMPRTVSTPDSRKLVRQTDRGTTENANLILSPQYKSPEYKRTFKC